MAIRKDISSLSRAKRAELRKLLDAYITKPTNNPVAEHKAAGNDMSLMIHDDGFVAWHQHFLAELENWLVMNKGATFVPLPYWDPAKPIPPELNQNNKDVNMLLPANLRLKALKKITSYMMLNKRLLPYHNAVHKAAGGQMPDPDTSPGDPIFWPFHAFLVSIYERWRNG